MIQFLRTEEIKFGVFLVNGCLSPLIIFLLHVANCIE